MLSPYVVMRLPASASTGDYSPYCILFYQPIKTRITSPVTLRERFHVTFSYPLVTFLLPSPYHVQERHMSLISPPKMGERK
jgi:hypothetical protein